MRKGREEIEAIATDIVDASMKVHTALGPGLLEGVYEKCLGYELEKRNHLVDRQLLLPVKYDGQNIDAGFRIDLLVGSEVVVELKTVEKIQPIHVAQTLTYLRLGDFCLGLLLNFNVTRMRDGVRRVVNGL